jgi:RNA recognition motif-containing protein
MAKLWIGNIAPDATDEDLRALLAKYGFPEAGAIERIADQGPRPAATVDFPGQISADLAEFARRIHDLFWRGRRLNVQVV